MTVGFETSFANNVVAPIFQSFPRVNRAQQKHLIKSNIFLFCLAKTRFLETLAGDQTSENYNAFEEKLELIEDMVSLLSNPSDPNNPNIHNTGDMTLLIQRNSRGPRGLLAQEYGNHCESFLTCLPELKDGPPTILSEYGIKATGTGTKNNFDILRRFCDRLKSLRFLGKPPVWCVRYSKPGGGAKRRKEE